MVDRLLRFGSSCIVINKPERVYAEPWQVRRLHDEGPGFPPTVLPEFDWLAPREDGRPAVLGPYDDPGREALKSVRVTGVPQGRAVPLVHAKLLLLGAVIESEGEMGETVLFF